VLRLWQRDEDGSASRRHHVARAVAGARCVFREDDLAALESTALAVTNLDFAPLVIGQSASKFFAVANTGGLDLSGTASTTPPFGLPDGSFVLASV